jgi:hypothetical protein
MKENWMIKFYSREKRSKNIIRPHIFVEGGYDDER